VCARARVCVCVCVCVYVCVCVWGEMRKDGFDNDLNATFLRVSRVF